MFTRAIRGRTELAQFIGCLLALVAIHATAATITVNSTDDIADPNDQKCTLREAISSASSHAPSGGAVGECAAGQIGLDTIVFSVAGTISPTSPMPQITETVTIDGYALGSAHPNSLAIGNNAVLTVEIDGTNVVGDLFTIAGGGSSTITGLVINRLAGSAIYITSSDSNKIAGNFFGTDLTGNTFEGTTGTPIQIRGNANVIGGVTPADRNVIVGGGGVNAGTILIMGLNGGNFIQGNYIGVSADGTTALQPSGGTDAIEILVSPNTTIGGTTAGARNVIVGTIRGIRLGGGGQTTNEIIEGNYIGTNATGTVGLGGQGITTDNGASNITIGGTTPGAGNVISGGSTAIFLGDGASAFTIQGNKIGTDASGTQPIPNGGNGIDIQVPGAGSIVGGINGGEGNTIAYNCGRGISIGESATYTKWAMLGNSIFANGGLGITLTGSDQPLDNETGDGDTGANNRQNYPVITSAPISAGIATISGTLNSEAMKIYRIEFFASDRCDASGSGEGRNFIGAVEALPTNNNGDASFGPLPFPVSRPGPVFTATATDPDGNTSEFSKCVGTPDHLFANGFEPSCGG